MKKYVCAVMTCMDERNITLSKPFDTLDAAKAELKRMYNADLGYLEGEYSGVKGEFDITEFTLKVSDTEFIYGEIAAVDL